MWKIGVWSRVSLLIGNYLIFILNKVVPPPLFCVERNISYRNQHLLLGKYQLQLSHKRTTTYRVTYR